MSLKQGLSYLIQQAKNRGLRTHFDQKTVIIPIYSFINQLIKSLKGFINSTEYDCWYAYFLDQHLYDRSLSNMISNYWLIEESWQKLKQTSLQCYLLQNLLTIKNKNKLRLYLKARKYITIIATQNSMLDQVLLTLQDSIAIIHKIFTNQQIRKALVQGIKNIFMAFKMSQAKIYSSVLIQYLLAVYDSIFKLQNQQATISGQFTTYKSSSKKSTSNQHYIQLYSSISNFQSQIHNQNGLYKKTNFSHCSRKKYQIIQKKFLPMRQTSQFISQAQSSKIQHSIQPRTSTDRQRSLFYEFIVQNSQQYNPISEEQNHIETINHTKSFDRNNSFQQPQRQFYRGSMQRPVSIQRPITLQRSIQRPTHDKQKSLSVNKRQQQRSKQKQKIIQYLLPNSKLTKKQIKTDNKNFQNPKFSLNIFSNKVYESSQSKQKDSLLRRSKQKLKKELQFRNSLRSNSTQRYEIENHLLKTNIDIQKLNENKKKSLERRRQMDVQSVKSEQFVKMISKNQQFKEKMLKKNYPSSGSQQNKQLQYSKLTQNNNKKQYNRPLFAGQGQQYKLLNSKDVRKQRINNLIYNRNNEDSMYQNQQKYIIGGSRNNYNINVLSEQEIKRMKQRNNRNLMNDSSFQSFSNVYKHRNDYLQEYLQEEDQINDNRVINKNNTNSKLNVKQNIVQQNRNEKPQVIHKSIGQNKKVNYYYPSQYNNSSDKGQQQKSLNYNKMKNLLQIIDDYRQNAQNQYDSNPISISQSFCKKSNFDSPNRLQSTNRFKSNQNKQESYQNNHQYQSIEHRHQTYSIHTPQFQQY